MSPFNVFRPFRSSHRDTEHAHGRMSRYDTYEQSREPVATRRSGSRWRNVLTKRRHPRDELYVNGPEYSVAPDSEIRRMMHPQRRTVVEEYDSQESVTDSENYPVRHPMPEQQTRFIERVPSHESFPQPLSDHYISRVPSHESFVPEQMPQPSLAQAPPIAPSFIAPPGDAYMEESAAPSVHDERSVYETEPPVLQAEPRRYRARRGEPITVGNMRIEVEDDGRHSRTYRSPRSGSRSTNSYSSLSSRSYSSSSSYDERPIIISADPHTQIEIGNEEDGFVPYEQYLAEREERRRRRRRHHRDTPNEEIYVIPAGANVIFVDEDGREIHRVGEFDDRYPSRRRNTSARTTRQADGSYLIEM